MVGWVGLTVLTTLIQALLKQIYQFCFENCIIENIYKFCYKK